MAIKLNKKQKKQIKEIAIVIAIFILIYYLKLQYAGDGSFSPSDGAMAFLNVGGG